MNYAGFWIRFVAHVIDFILLNAIELGLEYGIAGLLGLSPITQQILGVVFSLVLTYFYYCRYQVKTGTTIGKRLFSIYVVDEKTGEFMTHKQAIARTLGYLLSYVILGCGFLMVLFHPEKRGLHDLIAGTVSVRRKKVAAEPNLQA